MSKAILCAHLAVLVSAVFLQARSLGQETDPAAETTEAIAEQDEQTQDLTADEIARFIRQLDSPKFSERQEATRRLNAAGKAVVEPLASAAKVASGETLARTMEILENFHKSTDAELKAAAVAALQKLAESDVAKVSRLAKNVLEPSDAEPAPEPQRGGGIVIGPNGIQANGPIIIGDDGIKFGGMKIGKTGKIITTKVVVGGVRSVDVLAGDGRQILIRETQDKIEISVADLKQGGAAQTAQAKNADELKEKNAKLYEVYQAYDKYRKNGVTISGGFQIGG